MVKPVLWVNGSIFKWQLNITQFSIYISSTGNYLPPIWGCWKEVTVDFILELSQSKVGHSRPIGKPLSCPQKWTTCIMTSQCSHFAWGLSNKKHKCATTALVRYLDPHCNICFLSLFILWVSSPFNQALANNSTGCHYLSGSHFAEICFQLCWVLVRKSDCLLFIYLGAKIADRDCADVH